MASIPDFEELAKLGYGGAYPDFGQKPLEGLLGEAAEYDDGEGFFEGLTNRFKGRFKGDADEEVSPDEEVSLDGTPKVSTLEERADTLLENYLSSAGETKDALEAYNANPNNSILEAKYNESDSITQYYENKLDYNPYGHLGKSVPNVGEVVDIENNMIYPSEEHMAKKIGGREMWYKLDKERKRFIPEPPVEEYGMTGPAHDYGGNVNPPVKEGDFGGYRTFDED
jgi:hypothetical protein